MLVLSGEEVRRVLPMREAIRAIRTALAQFSDGLYVVPGRTHLNLREYEGVALVMPGYSAATGRAVTKVVTLHSHNPEIGLSRLHSVVLLFDAPTGIPLCLMDGGALTALRTGACSGVATDLLARADAAYATVFGAGPQARTQLEAVAAVRELKCACVYDPNIELAQRFAAEMRGRLDLDIWGASSPYSAMEHADIVCTATASETPVLEDDWVRPGMHINAIGCYKPHAHELPSATVIRSRVFVDTLEGAMEEAGDILVPMKAGLIGPEHVVGEIGDVLLERVRGRTSPEDITVYKSVGSAAQDLAAASTAFERARTMGVGTEVSL